jgi:hypothetical protein
VTPSAETNQTATVAREPLELQARVQFSQKVISVQNGLNGPNVLNPDSAVAINAKSEKQPSIAKPWVYEFKS